MDCSHHDWFEGRTEKCVLMAYIDDATNKAYFRFYEYEGTIPAMDSFLKYIRKCGIPMSIYFDSTPLTNRQQSRQYKKRQTEKNQVRNKFTISHNGGLYQIQEPVTNKKVTVEEHMDGKMIITNNGRSIKFQSILIRPEIGSKEKKCKRRRPTSHIPSEDHPYRKTYRKTAAMKNNPPLEAAA